LSSVGLVLVDQLVLVDGLSSTLFRRRPARWWSRGRDIALGAGVLWFRC
jgi:hypothetical protein